MQGNNQKSNSEWCPNTIFNNGKVSIGEFKTLEEAMNFPIKEIWCINRTNDNLFEKYQSQGVRILIICDWTKPTQDPQKFVVALVSKSGKIYYWDMNDLPIMPPNKYENSIENDVLYAIFSIADSASENNRENINCNRIMNKKLIRLTESDLHNIVREAIEEVLSNPQNSNRQLEKLYNKIMTLIEPVQDKGSLDKNSTYWIVSKVHYDVKFDGKCIRVKRTEIERGGKTYKDSWVLTERNYMEKWKDSYDNPLRDQINYDRKCARFFESEYGSDYEF